MLLRIYVGVCIMVLIVGVFDLARAVSFIRSFEKMSYTAPKGFCRVVIDINECGVKEFQKILKEKWMDHILHIERCEDIPFEGFRYVIDFLSVGYTNSFLKDLEVSLPTNRWKLKWRELL